MKTASAMCVAVCLCAVAVVVARQDRGDIVKALSSYVLPSHALMGARVLVRACACPLRVNVCQCGVHGIVCARVQAWRLTI